MSEMNPIEREQKKKQLRGRVIDTARIELPLESDKERARACALSVRAEPEEPCRVQARVLVTPLDGETAAGYLTLADWEVSAR